MEQYKYTGQYANGSTYVNAKWGYKQWSMESDILTQAEEAWEWLLNNQTEINPQEIISAQLYRHKPKHVWTMRNNSKAEYKAGLKQVIAVANYLKGNKLHHKTLEEVAFTLSFIDKDELLSDEHHIKFFGKVWRA